MIAWIIAHLTIGFFAIAGATIAIWLTERKGKLREYKTPRAMTATGTGCQGGELFRDWVGSRWHSRDRDVHLRLCLLCCNIWISLWPWAWVVAVGHSSSDSWLGGCSSLGTPDHHNVGKLADIRNELSSPIVASAPEFMFKI